jgi:hypothetical protein
MESHPDRVQQHRIDNREQCGHDANAEAERQDGNGGKDTPTPKAARCKADVVQN